MENDPSNTSRPNSSSRKVFIPSNNRRHGRGRKRKGRGGASAAKESRQRTSGRCCVVCGDAQAKYKCPKCRGAYCSVACCKGHKNNCPAAASVALASSSSGQAAEGAAYRTADDNVPASPQTRRLRSKYLPSDALTQDPVENALRRRRMLDESDGSDEELEPGHKITREMMDRLDGSAWLKKELEDGGLRRMIAEIDAADDQARRDGRGRYHSQGRSVGVKDASLFELGPRERVLEVAKRDNPNFANFIDRLLLTAGVLQIAGGDEMSFEQLVDGDGYSGRLVLVPIERGARPCLGKEDIIEQETQASSDGDESSVEQDADEGEIESCTESSSCSSTESSSEE